MHSGIRRLNGSFEGSWASRLSSPTNLVGRMDKGDYLKERGHRTGGSLRYFTNSSDTAPLFEAYLKAQTAEEREKAATFAMLKMPYLSPYLVAGVPDLYTGDDGYYLESAWWCVLAESEYHQDGKEVPKQVGFPSFLQPETLEAAKKERAEMISLGDAKTILGKRVTEWVNKDQNDPRLPEALFIAVKANESYKYGCNGWEHDEKIRSEAETLLLERYGGSPWAAKLRESRQ